MVEVVINYDKDSKEFRLYENSTKALLVSADLAKGLISLNEFLKTHLLIKEDIILSNNINYHLDSESMIAILQSNVNLMNQLKQGPSSFTTSASKFGASTNQMPPNNKFDNAKKCFGSKFMKNGCFGKSKLAEAYKKMEIGGVYVKKS